MLKTIHVNISMQRSAHAQSMSQGCPKLTRNTNIKRQIVKTEPPATRPSPPSQMRERYVQMATMSHYMSFPDPATPVGPSRSSLCGISLIPMSP
jgi:hypothetical protein